MVRGVIWVSVMFERRRICLLLESTSARHFSTLCGRRVLLRYDGIVRAGWSHGGVCAGVFASLELCRRMWRHYSVLVF